ncbi:hypothetical protein ES703_04016 [subsurface metagenome]
MRRPLKKRKNNGKGQGCLLPFVDIEREIDQPKSLVKLSIQMLSFVKVQERNFLARMMHSKTLNKGENKVVRYDGLWDMQILPALTFWSFWSP